MMSNCILIQVCLFGILNMSLTLEYRLRSRAILYMPLISIVKGRLSPSEMQAIEMYIIIHNSFFHSPTHL